MPLSDHVDWIREIALPFWFEHAADQDGLFYETLSLSGRPHETAELRIRTGLRQIYVFSEAAHLGLAPKQDAIELATRMASRLRDVAWGRNERPGWSARLLRDGTIIDDCRDLYDHAFALLAFASLARVTHRQSHLDQVTATMSVIESFASCHGGWVEGSPATLPRRQNPHMHLFEACLAVFEATGEKSYLSRARRILELLRNKFWDPQLKLLTEFFGPAWERSASFGCDRFDPGHMAEWVWLLRRFARIEAAQVDGMCYSLLEASSRLGRKPNGFLVDEIDHQGNPLINSCRLWLQTEYLKALIVESERQERPELLESACAFVQAIHRTYLDVSPPGTWCDRINLDGQRISTNTPASTLYHLFAVVPEIIRLGPTPNQEV